MGADADDVRLGYVAESAVGPLDVVPSGQCSTCGSAGSSVTQDTVARELLEPTATREITGGLVSPTTVSLLKGSWRSLP